MSAGQIRMRGRSSRQTPGHVRRAALRHRVAPFALAAPSLVLVAVLVLVPCFWLFWLSAFDVDGHLSFENYRTLLVSAGYRNVFLTTFLVAFATVLITMSIGVPFSLFLVSVQGRSTRLLLTAVLLSFWTSVLVRVYAWLVLLQRNGVVNTLLIDLGITSGPLPLVFNFSAAVLGMVHTMLPVFILPVYGAMSRIDPELMRAAASFGASRSQALRKVFLPLAMPGIAASGVLVFVASLGFYVTPAILGGGRVSVIAMSIARSLSNFTSYGAASALGVLLLIATAIILGGGHLAMRVRFRTE